MQHEKDLVEIAGEIVKAQALGSNMSADDLTEAIKKVYRALKWIQTQEEKAAQPAEEFIMTGPESIQRNKVICLECGKEFKVLTGKHLAMHKMDPKEYKKKHGILLRQSLSCKSLSAKRRRTAMKLGLGERLQKARKRKGKK